MPTPVWVQGFIFYMLAMCSVLGQAATNGTFAVRAERAFVLAQKEFAAHPEIATNAWQLGRTSYDWAEFATNTEQRAAVAQVGIDACRKLIARDPKSAPGHYYLAMDYGELAEAESPSMAAYKLIREIEHEFTTAAELDEHYDYAGPVRCLGLLYRDAPSWPISIGSKRKAREYLERAATLAPDYPENHLNLVESNVTWHQADEAEKAWQKLAVVWPAAQTNLAGVAWEPSWNDWATRKQKVQADFQKTFKEPLKP